ncbi:hypothetical protein B0H21DRAFT_703083 [Amylocystis lapponica]|nr:hypothetical protein B0H21DRAFT_703083 [Amylocystis lapponica]
MQGSPYADPKSADPKAAYAPQGAPYYPPQGSPYATQGSPYYPNQGNPYPQGSQYPQQGSPYPHAGSPFPPGPSAHPLTNSPFAPGPSGGAPLGAPPTQQTSQDRLKGFAPGQSVAQLLEPPPEAFRRTPPRHLPYSPFEPTVLPGLSTRLEDGFSTIPPPYHGPYHPFATHDVNEEDWRCFLNHVKRAGSLSPMNRIIAQVAPMAMGLSLPVGILVSKGIETHMKKEKGGPVGELVDHWNYYFFHPRCMHATLAQGKMTYTGTDNVPPDMVGRKGKGSSHAREYDDSSSSSSDDSSRGRGGIGSVLQSRRERKDARRQARRSRKAQRRDFKDSSSDKWRLILSYNPPLL